jgi:hypothetical protein
MSRDLLTTVIERWRSATMSHRVADDDFNDFADAPSLQPAPMQAPSIPAAAPRPEGLRSSLLKKPLDASSFGNPQPGSPGFSSKFR